MPCSVIGLGLQPSTRVTVSERALTPGSGVRFCMPRLCSQPNALYTRRINMPRGRQSEPPCTLRHRGAGVDFFDIFCSIEGTEHFALLSKYISCTLFSGRNACVSEIAQAISAVRQFGGRSGMIRQPQCRNWLHFYRITCRLSKIGRKKV